MRTMILVLLLCSIVGGQDQQAANPFLAVGNGNYPDGLLETDIKKIQQKRIEAAQLCVEVLRNRYERGLINMSIVLEAQIEFLHARLDATETKEERLKCISDVQEIALKLWQHVIELHKIGARGGEADAEAQARAHVFKLRAMYLKELQASESPNPTPLSKPIESAPYCDTKIHSGKNSCRWPNLRLK